MYGKLILFLSVPFLVLGLFALAIAFCTFNCRMADERTREWERRTQK